MYYGYGSCYDDLVSWSSRIFTYLYDSGFRSFKFNCYEFLQNRFNLSILYTSSYQWFTRLCYYSKQSSIPYQEPNAWNNCIHMYNRLLFLGFCKFTGRHMHQCPNFYSNSFSESKSDKSSNCKTHCYANYAADWCSNLFSIK